MGVVKARVSQEVVVTRVQDLKRITPTSRSIKEVIFSLFLTFQHSQLGQTLYKMSSSTTPPYPVAELLLVSPLVPGGIALSSKKRRITPTVEALSPKRVAVITKPGAVSPLVNSLDCSTFPNQFGWPSQAELVHIGKLAFPPME